MNEKEFDRSKCFTFFASYRKQGERIKELLGPEKALEYYEAIIDYGLYSKEISKELLIYIGDTTLETIDSSQEKRSRGFGENMTLTRSILDTLRDHPEYSQNRIAEELHTSKGKVNKVLTKYRKGEYADFVDYNLVINKIEYTPEGKEISVVGTGTNNSTYNNNNNYNSTDRYRDRLDATVSGSFEDVADAPKNSANAARSRLPEHLPEEFKNMDFGARIDNKSMLEVMNIVYRKNWSEKDDEWETDQDIRDNLIKEFTGGSYCGKNDEVTRYADFLMEYYK